MACKNNLFKKKVEQKSFYNLTPSSCHCQVCPGSIGTAARASLKRAMGEALAKLMLKIA